jgi:hypothetical protein
MFILKNQDIINYYFHPGRQSAGPVHFCTLGLINHI